MVRKIKKESALALTLALMLTALAVLPGTVHGADAIDTTNDECSVTFDLSDTTFAELTGADALPVTVNLYRVASVSENGRYTAEAPYQTALEGLDDVNDRTSAEEWQKMAEAAAKIVKPEGEDGTSAGGVQTTAWTTGLTEGKGTITGDSSDPLLPGLYLALAEPVESSLYRYTFQPALVALPGNRYYETGTDAWVYDVTVGLKPQRENRLGSLVIEKTIDTYQPRGEADRILFVFQVEVRKTEEGAAGPEERLYYSNVVALDFDAAGTKSLEIPGLPAGAVATVTEVYSGVSYTIPAGEATVRSEPVAADGRVSVSFTNQYNGSLSGGSGVVNHFAYDGSTWQPDFQ